MNFCFREAPGSLCEPSGEGLGKLCRSLWMELKGSWEAPGEASGVGLGKLCCSLLDGSKGYWEALWEVLVAVPGRGRDSKHALRAKFRTPAVQTCARFWIPNTWIFECPAWDLSHPCTFLDSKHEGRTSHVFLFLLLGHASRPLAWRNNKS